MGARNDERCSAPGARMAGRMTDRSRALAAAGPASRSTSRARFASLPLRAALAVVVIATFACGIVAGLARLGVAVPAHAAARAVWHGVLMVPVFFGAMISLERAVAIGYRWNFAGPVAAAAAGAVLLAGGPVVVAQTALVIAGTVLLAGSVLVFRRQPALYLGVLAVAASCWWLGNVVWLVVGEPFPSVPYWLAFLVLTIVAERLELTRMRPLRPHVSYVFGACVAVALVSLAWMPAQQEQGSRLFAASLLFLALWLAKYDIARYTVRQSGLTRYIAVCLLSGYGWFAASGALGLDGALIAGHPWHDAALHALTLGFVFSMVFGHAPIVLPAVTRLRVKYRPLFYVPLAMLHAGVALRVAGSLAGQFSLKRLGSELAAAALLSFVIVMLTGVWSARRGDR